MRLWHLLVQQMSKSDNPENLIILKILVQTTARGQSTQSTPNTRVVFGTDIVGGNPGLSDLLSALKTPLTSIYGTKLTPMVRLGNRTYRPENRTNPVNWVLFLYLEIKLDFDQACNCSTILLRWYIPTFFQCFNSCFLKTITKFC